MDLIKLIDIRKTYVLGEVDVPVLKGVSLTIERGEMVALMGASGSGKSTLLTLVAGLDKPTAGSIRVEGADVEKLEGRDLDRYLLTTVGIVFQNFNLISAFSTAENVMFPMLLAGKSRFEARGRALDLLGEVGMEDRTDHTPSELSGGEQQRVAVAVALANDPAVILADEPTAELDSKTGQFVVEKLRNQAHRQKKLVVVATHDDTIAALADRVVRLQDGRIHESGLKASPNH